MKLEESKLGCYNGGGGWRLEYVFWQIRILDFGGFDFHSEIPLKSLDALRAPIFEGFPQKYHWNPPRRAARAEDKIG